MKYEKILWDFNGTILDDVQASVECVNDLMDELHKPRTNINEYRDMMKIPLQDYYSQLIDLNQFSFEQCTKQFQKSYAKHLNLTEISLGVLEVLEYFKSTCTKQYIVSSFEQSVLDNTIKLFKLQDFFEKISGSDDIFCGEKYSRAKLIVGDTPKSKVLYIGDTTADAQTADEVGCDCILVSCGHQSRKLLENHGYPVVDEITQILDII